MEKHNTINMKYLILLLFINNNIFSQNNAIAPRSGAIVFVKEEIIYDKELYVKSFKELMPKMKKAMEKQIVFECLTDGKKVDTTLLKSEVEKTAQNFEMMLPFMLEEDNEKIKFYNEFNKDIITKYYTVDSKLIKNKIIINQTTLEVKDEYDEYVEIEKNEIIKLTEYKNDIREINGFNCFKVIYSYNEPNVELDFLANVTSNSRELWVTQEIKCNYHPVINEIEILEKYYPLEIIEYSDDIKGKRTTYKIESLTINLK